MATLKAIIRKGQVKQSGLTNVKIQIIHKRSAVYISTNIFVKPIDFSDGNVQETDKNFRHKNLTLHSELLEYERDLIIIDSKLPHLSAQQVRDCLKKNDDFQTIDFFQYSKRRCDQLKNNGRESTAESYTHAVGRLKEFVKVNYLPFSDITAGLLQDFEAWIRKECSTGTVINRMGSIRALFNSAVDELNQEGFDPVIINYPFRKYKLPKRQIKKRNVPAEAIKKLQEKKLTERLEIIARDIVILQFYLIGINAKDLFYATLDQIKDNRLVFDRFKTKRPYSILIEPEARAILDKYKGKKYLLRFADLNKLETEGHRAKHARKNIEQYTDQRSFVKMLNHNLQEIAKEIKINEGITTYYMRHTWATIAAKLEIPKETISAALGHGMNTVTDIYIDFSQDKIDKANRKVIDYVLSIKLKKN